MPENTPDITLLIATYNRAPVLRETLYVITQVDRSGIDCEIVVIDNNSDDETASVVRSFQDRLPLKLLRETRPGKNCALNKALRECALREVVVFADDDISPDPNWFQAIATSVDQWPEAAVFGGAIEILWPQHHQPEWAEAEWIRAFGYSWHRYAETAAFYTPPACPFGPNYWVRRSVFQKVPFFDESIGPRANDRIMGSETSFLMELHRSGLRMLYYPPAVIRHRIMEKECRIPALRRRGFAFGRGQVRLHGWHRRSIYDRSKALWVCTLAADYIFTSVRFGIGALHKNSKKNCEITVDCMIRFGLLYETRQLAWEKMRSGSNCLSP